jgi:ubiquinone biosynthesis protein
MSGAARGARGAPPEGRIPRKRRRGGTKRTHAGATSPNLSLQEFETYVPTRPPGLLGRFLVVHAHLFGLAAGALVEHVDRRRAEGARGFRFGLLRAIAALARRLVRRDLAGQPVAVQLRRRLELLGPTYIKLGQILSLREDILPAHVTDELKHLLNQLPVVPFSAFRELVERDLGRPLVTLFAWVDETPLASASIAQIHRATTLEGDDVVIKAVKPGIRETLQRDARLLRMLGAAAQLPFGRYNPRRIIAEFCDYTLREVDLRREADNAETFASNFTDSPDIVFPHIHRGLSAQSVLTMEFLDGLRPDDPRARSLPLAQREQLVELGSSAIIRMLYGDGFFHADLHPGNLLVLPGPKAGFIDLGMVGRLDPELRRTLLYYYYALVTGDAENAARYLTAVAVPGRGGDATGFRRAVAEISGRWKRASDFDSFSLARLILESVAQGGRFRMYFPVELVLMVKALVTFEGVGHLMLPGFDVAEVSRAHIRRIFIRQFSPARLLQEELRSAPDLVDALMKIPLLVTEGVRVLERNTKRSGENPLAGVRGTLLAGFALVAGAILLAFEAPWPLWSTLFVVSVILGTRRGG